MEKPKTIRLLDELGRISIPPNVRAIMNWDKSSELEIWLNSADGEVILKSHTYSCTYCGGTEDLKEFNKHRICALCQNAISNL